MRIISYLLMGLVLMVSWSCKDGDKQKDASAEGVSEATLYFGGGIITMEGDSPEYAEALAERDGKIVFVGSKEEAVQQLGENYKEVDLKGQTMLPGFIDGHAHFFGFGAQAVMANLLASPDGNVNTIDDLVATLSEWYEANGTDKTQGWIVGMGYDDAILKEGRHPTKEDLDKVSTEVPIMAVHISGHFAVVNSKGLEEIGYTAETKDPSGGVIRRMENSMEPNGVLEELAAIPIMIQKISPTSPELVKYYMDKGQEIATSFGYTTAQEGRAMQNHLQMAEYAEAGHFKIDVVSYVDYMFPQYFDSEWYGNDYKNHYRIGGVKLTLDGSPQGRTAWRHEPYILPPDGQKKGYSGYPAIPEDSVVQGIVNKAFENDWQLLAHTNGDAAADQLLRVLAEAGEQYGNEDRRTVLIHGQLLRMDQLDSLKKYDVVASLFPMHTFYWGDWYKEIIGPEAAQKISPIKSALNRGVKVTAHTDAPVALPNLMMIAHTAVNRLSRSGTVMGPDERLTPYEALQCLTSWSAWQHFEEDRKGTLTPGKLADLVILDKDPLKVDPLDIMNIRVMETIKEGETVFKRPGDMMAKN
ncbi:amidohydrolase [Robertkochia sediminum]|uniref:amidohydrolase n=1 Tax=Robertkochia sediminum TaxID=2785326 RepID=UPI001932E37F|nr:amidohydrolase [Robertkochia sediminum]MBL7472866.1 amidohydrolase [Robertkochia sediminum]